MSSDKSIHFISCMNYNYYQIIGKRFLQSIIKFVSNDPLITITIFCENFLPSESHPRLNYISTNNFEKTYHTVLKNPKVKSYVKKYAHKVFSVIYTLKKSPCDFVIWLDSDVLIHHPMTRQWMLSILVPNELFSWYLSNGSTWGMETGFMAFNNHHKQKALFLKHYQKFYKTPENRGPLPKFKDAFVFAASIKHLPLECHKNIARLPSTVEGLFKNSEISQCITHYISNNKYTNKLSQKKP